MLLLSYCITVSSAVLYVSPGGRDTNPGTIDLPFYTLSKAWAAAFSGDVIYVRGGTYTYSSGTDFRNKNATSANPIKIWAYPGEYPVIDYSNLSPSGQIYGMYLYNVSYIHVKGIRITGISQPHADIPQYGLVIANTNNCTFEEMETDHIGGWGVSIFDNNNNDLFLNCDSHHNADPYSSNPYGGSDGFECGSASSTNITFKGCRAWSNSDDGWDLREASGVFFLENCWSFWNGYREDGSTAGGNGEGFKLGGKLPPATTSTLRTVKYCLAFENRTLGFSPEPDLSENELGVELYNCTSYHNVGVGINFEYRNTAIVRNNLIYNNSAGNLYVWGPNVTHDHNNVDIPIKVTDADFLSVNSSGTDGERQSDGSLPDLNFMKLAKGSALIDAGVDLGFPFDGPAPDLGAYEYLSSQPPPVPALVSLIIANAAPTVVVLTYDMLLDNTKIPGVSSYSVMSGSTPLTVSSVSVSQYTVKLTLSTAVKYGDAITLSYTAPGTNAVQTASGGVAINQSGRTVTNNVNPVPVPAYVSSVIQNATPTSLDITYSLSLANFVPGTSSFTVMVNSVARPVSSLTVSGTTVSLKLANAILYGDIVTVAYTKPSSNPLQTSLGGIAASIGAQTVTNNVAALTAPLYVSSVVQNTTPGNLDITYNLTLANVIPATTAFAVKVNNVLRTVSTVSISGTVVTLKLGTPAAYGDVITVAYTKPSTNALQSAAGGQAATINAQPVTNNCRQQTATNDPPVISIKNPASIFSGFIGDIDATGTSDINNDALTYAWTVPANVPVSSVSASRIQFLSPLVLVSQNIEFQLAVSDGKSTVSKTIQIAVNPYKPELSEASISSVKTSNFQTPDYAKNVTDGNLGTKWASSGEDQWLLLELTKPCKISYVQLTFLQSLAKQSYFDLYASKDNVTWDPIFIIASSCNFSGGTQVFDFPASFTNTDYSYLKYVGHCNALNNWNYISELKVFGVSQQSQKPVATVKSIVIYPNPATNVLNIAIQEPDVKPDMLKVLDLSGKTFLEKILNPTVKNVQIPLNIGSGVYIVELLTSGLVVFHQRLIIMN